MYQYLKPRNGPVFNGLEHKEVVYAANQPQYIPLRTLVSSGPQRRVISRWTFTPEQRKAIADGADIFLQLLTFGDPLQPIAIAVTDDNADPLDRGWIKACLLSD